ncbi:MAG: VWA domain-containing protein [Planctomycetes bacterium]|nr:VWA domain-containing protein [Planctomycetota bacterium]MCB9936272.1 VWA domain-containing protein [Planctomycetota bacterium]
MILLAFAALALLCATPIASADKLEGDEAKAAKDRLKDVKRDWKKADRATRISLLHELARLPERTVGNFLVDVVDDDESDEVALVAAWALVYHNEPDDSRELTKSFNKAKTPGRRAACVRWLGQYGADSPLKELKKIALDADASAEAATHAVADINSEDAWNAIEMVAQSAKLPEARRVAIARLLARGDKRGVECMANSANLEDAAWAAHFAIGTGLETEALKQVLEFAKRPLKLAAGKRPHFFGSLLARLRAPESHKAVVEAAGGMSNQFDAEIGWWLISVNRGPADYKAASRWLRDEDAIDIINGLRYLQRLPEPLAGEDLKLANETLAPLLAHADDEVVAHALLTCLAAGACKDAVEAKASEWLKDDKPFRRAAALLTAGRAGMKSADRALELLKDDCWYVQSAALDCLLRLRPADCAWELLAYAEKQAEGRMFSEAIALLCDLTGQDFGDQLEKWSDWLKANEKFGVQPRKLESLRGVPHQRLKQKTAAKFYGLEINSINLQFAIDRSVSMVNPVSREPERPDFPSRKADILKRRPEVGRMVREGFLPRFHVAAAEVAAALDGLSQNAKFGITLFNHEHIDHERVGNDIKSRKDAVNWMLSTDVQGGTDIKAALLSIIEKGEADTILLLSDGEPMSLSILEMISRANAIKRVNILVVSIHKDLFNRHYLNALATRDYGQIVDAEPRD